MSGERAAVVVVGGGVFGCAVAWSLARRGVRDLVLLERGELAAQTTSRAAALLTRLRAKPGQTAMVAATRDAIAALGEELRDDFPEGLPLRRAGSLHVAASAAADAELAALVALAAEVGERHEVWGRDEIARRVPWLDAGRLVRGVWIEDDAHLDPYLLATAFARAARGRGASLRTGVDVVELLREGARVTGVRTDRGAIRADHVVLCAGPWTGTLTAGELGVHLPMAPVRSHYWITAPDPAFSDDQPFVVLPDAHAYARVETGALLFGLRDGQSLVCDPRTLPRDLGDLRWDADPTGDAVLEEGGPRLAELVPRLGELGLAHYVSGPSTYTPDGQFVVGELPGWAGVLVATGCCGAGIAASGGVGRAIAARVVDGESDLDLAPFRPDRFGAVDATDPGWLARCARARSRKTTG